MLSAGGPRRNVGAIQRRVPEISGENVLAHFSLSSSRARTAVGVTAALTASFVVAPLTTNAPAANAASSMVTCTPASGVFGTAPWSLDVNCTVHVGAGVLGSGALTDVIPTHDVQSIVFDAPRSTSFASTASRTFQYLPELASIKGINDLDTKSLRYTSSMFEGATSLTALDLSGWDVSQVTSLTSMFKNASG